MRDDHREVIGEVGEVPVARDEKRPGGFREREEVVVPRVPLPRRGLRGIRPEAECDQERNAAVRAACVAIHTPRR
jgi:hypothetical protein